MMFSKAGSSSSWIQQVEVDGSSSSWTREEDKAFENALAMYSGDINPWEKIAESVPGRTIEDIKEHYKLLVEDVQAIESGHVPLPKYAGHVGTVKSTGGRQKLRKSPPWTAEEHRLFLLGLKKYGPGDWISISRNCVVTKTHIQVASHAQKYFRRLALPNDKKKRPSIHDVTSVDDEGISDSDTPAIGNISIATSDTLLTSPTTCQDQIALPFDGPISPPSPSSTPESFIFATPPQCMPPMHPPPCTNQ